MADTCTLHMLHTNDLHSHFATMPRIATCFRTHREKWEHRGEHVLIADIGDHMDRMDIKSEASYGKVNVSVMNRTGYEYATIGNNEGITLPKERLNDMYEEAVFTVIAGNLLDPQIQMTPKWAVPYVIHEYQDLRVALLAVTIPFIPSYSSMGWEIREPIPIIREQLAALRDRADVFVLLSHLGYQADCRLAAKIEGLDVILGAHTHHTLQQGERIGKTLVAQTGKFGQHVGHVRLVWNRKTQQVTDASAELFATADYLPDEELTTFLFEEHVKAEQILLHPVAELEHDLQAAWMEETPFGSFLAASIRSWTGAEIGLANGGLLLADLHQGKISFADLLQSLPHPINACAVTLTGEQLTNVLEQAIQPETIQRELRGCGFRGKVEGWMGVDGLRIRYIAGEHPHIVQIEVNGQPLVMDREYRVGTVDMYMYNRLFPDLLQGSQIQFFLPQMLREVVAQTVMDQRVIQQSFLPRWEQVTLPEEKDAPQ
ncbi:bifunctional UDP-sugar hydrolase/5'-nucleotidase [Brevibacillus choshinensis]|uniref:bifunctional metallophosphatase/5'-nucleotidase n=1 Tax=Brevibacillus choshinensis TaxID=54911 RepID=UPI002E1AB579|nr:bifunctional UDP-sugar hydrolase/5'-nucleotidase [Brevibacillus choshinensis]